MTSEKNACKRIVILSLSLLFFLNLSAKMPGQHEVPNVNVGSNCHGYLEYLPVGYNPSGSTRYPLLINILGLNTTGDGSQASLDLLYNIHSGNPHDQAYDNVWPDAFTVNGQTFQFIVITPQFIQDMNSHMPTPFEVDEVINYIVANYKIDTSRIYLMGSSQGGGVVWDYAGSSSQYAKRLAAILPFGGVSFPFQEKANIMKFGKVAVWAFHNDFDNAVPSSFTKDYVDFYNKTPLPFGITARKTIFNASGHECWLIPMTRQYPAPGSGELNIYQWMLQYHTDPTKANAGDDQEILLSNNQATLTASGGAPNGSAASYHWEKYFGPTTGGAIQSPNSQSTVVNNLSQGSYIFKLTITGTDNSTAVDYVAVTVNPTQQRIEDNLYTGSSGVSLNNPTTESSNGNLTRINDISNNDWISYSVTVPAAGTYRFRFRAGTFYGNTRFKVQNSNGTQDLSAPVTMYTTNWDVYMNLYTDVNLQAGTQTIRIQNYPNAGSENSIWYLNWFEIINNTTAVYDAVNAPLPVTFTLFNAHCSGNSVNLTWNTASESNSQQFAIEKSFDGRIWNTIATVDAAGQSSTEKKYNYVDNTASGNDFYRIVQQDKDGRKTFTSVLRNNCGSKQAFTVFPNPANDKTTITINSNQNAKLNVSIVDNKGAVVRKQQTVLPQGSNQVTINLTGLAKGVYTLQAEWNGERKTAKLIKN
jgi:predicted esterase